MYTCVLWEIQEMEPGINHPLLKSLFPKALIRMSSLGSSLCVSSGGSLPADGATGEGWWEIQRCAISAASNHLTEHVRSIIHKNLDDDGKAWMLLLLNVQYFSFASHFCYLKKEILFAQCRVHQSVLEKYYLTALFWFLRNASNFDVMF